MPESYCFRRQVLGEKDMGVLGCMQGRHKSRERTPFIPSFSSKLVTIISSRSNIPISYPPPPIGMEEWLIRSQKLTLTTCTGSECWQISADIVIGRRFGWWCDGAASFSSGKRGSCLRMRRRSKWLLLNSQHPLCSLMHLGSFGVHVTYWHTCDADGLPLCKHAGRRVINHTDLMAWFADQGSAARRKQFISKSLFLLPRSLLPCHRVNERGCATDRWSVAQAAGSRGKEWGISYWIPFSNAIGIMHNLCPKR